MGILDFIWKKETKKHELTEEDREKAAELNRMRFENARLKLEADREKQRLEAEKEQARLQRDIANYRAAIEPGEEEQETGNPELGLLMSMFAASQAHPSTPQAVSPTTPLSSQTQPALSLTDEEIDQILKKMPKPMFKMARGMPPETLRKIVEQKYGAIDADTFGRAINKLRS